MKKQRGAALATALLLFLFVALLGGSLLRTSAAGKMLSAREASGAQAYYVAESALWQAISNPETYAPSLFASGRAEIQGVFDDQGKNYRVVIERLPAKGENMYLASAYGMTPYSERLAAAEVRITRLYDVTSVAAFHFGGMNLSGQQSLVPNYTSTTGNIHPIEHHFSGSDVAIDGELTLSTAAVRLNNNETVYRHGRESYNIWGVNDDGEQYRLLTKFEAYPDPLDQYDTHPSSYPNGADTLWLQDKHGKLADDYQFPDLADHIRQGLKNEIEGGEWGPLAAGSSNSVLLVGNGNVLSDYNNLKSNKPVSGAVTSAKSVYQGTPSTQVDIAASGYLWLKPQESSIIVDQLYLLGDLFIIAENCDVLLKNIHSNGYRLVVIAERTLDSSTGGSIVVGGSMNEWSPFPAQSTVTRYFLGPNSCLWAERNLYIKGSLRPDTAEGRADPDKTDLNSWDPATETIRLDNVANWPSIGLVAKEGSLRFHAFKARGVVYAGGSIEAFQLRLHGLAMIADPYRLGNDNWIGITQLHLSTSADAQTLGDILNITDYYVEVVAFVK